MDVTRNPQVDREPGAHLAEQIQEVDADDAAPGVAIGVVTGSQARGALLWGAAGAVVGALLGMALAFIPMQDVELAFRLAVAMVIGAVAGGVAGAVFGGGWQPREHRRPHAVDQGSS
jgi:hypothetical protein